jgi:hypothetical protein
MARTWTRLTDENGVRYVDLGVVWDVANYWPAKREPSLKLATVDGAYAYVLATAENCAAISQALGIDLPVPDKTRMVQKAEKAKKFLPRAQYFAKLNAERKAAGVDANGVIVADSQIPAQVGSGATNGVPVKQTRRGRPKKAQTAS